MKMRPADVRIDAMASMVGSVEADSGEGGSLGEKAGQEGIGGDRGESLCHLLVANQHGQDRIDLRWIERCPADIAQVAR